MEIATDTNVNSEMSDLVRQAEEWAIRDNSSKKVDNEKLSNLKRMENRILTKAAILLFEKYDITTVEKYNELFGNKIMEKEKEAVRKENHDTDIVFSPLDRQEFASILKSGWGMENVSPIKEHEFQAFLKNDHRETMTFTPKRRNSILSNIIPLSPIVSDESLTIEKPAKFRKSEPALPIFSSTPRQSSISFNRANSFHNTPKYSTPVRVLTTPNKRMTPKAGETPLENRASRLRRLKMEEMKK